MNTYANNLKEAGVSDDEVLARTKKHGQRYGNKLRRARARMIARTEIAYAQNRGMYDTLIKANADGVLGASAQKEWLTGPTDVCEICRPMAGQKVPLKSPFNVGGNFVDYPPAHPNCRCFILPVAQLSESPMMVGSGTQEDAFRYIFPDGFGIEV